jgi:glycosyltransferase involved in cell wall biosynthesis
MIVLFLAGAAVVFAALPAWLFRANLRRYSRLPDAPVAHAAPAISVLIPARNEENSIRAAVQAVLTNSGVECEVLVLDDHSEDATGRIVRELASQDRRVRYVPGPDLPAGWCGKQHACWVLAQEATHDWLLFLDADVRLSPNALQLMGAFAQASEADLLSGVPRQETGSWLERLLIPLIHFFLLGFLPLERMRRSRHPAYAAGCGQLFLARKSAYLAAGGHGAIRATLHDGLRLPRAFRAAGHVTDLFDATDVATCRMYRSSREVWNGLAKNATEGLAAPRLILPATVLLLTGQVLPLMLVSLPGMPLLARILAGIALVLAYYPRVRGVARFGQPVLGAALHPLGILLFLLIQWYALILHLIGRPTGWKGRNYHTSPLAGPVHPVV